MLHLDSTDLQRILDFIRKHSGMVFPPEKQYLLELRLWPLAQQKGYASLREFIGSLVHSHNHSLCQEVLNAVAINETYFFRDANFYQALQTQIFPELIDRHRQDRQLTFWCAASSSGQEPYSILMLLHELYPFTFNWNFTFIASDISTRMLERSKEGSYMQIEVDRGLSPQQLNKYFDGDAQEWKIKEFMRNKIDFRRINLNESWSIPKMDLIFMRNVLIYFDTPAKIQIMAQIRRTLKSDGLLFLGNGETTLQLDDNYQRISLPKAECYKLKG